MIDVVIAGAGPNGLMLACELSLAGVRPVVLERLTERATEPRANGLVGQSVCLLDRRGLYEPLSGSASPPVPVPGFVFGALPLDLSQLEDNPLYTLAVPQQRLEQVLEERAISLGVTIRRGHELVGLTEGPRSVQVDVSGPDGTYRLDAGYLVGADGGHSATRKLAGIGFPGVSRDDSVSRQAHVRLADELVDPVTGGLVVPGYGVVPPFLHHRTERGMFVWARFPSAPAMISTLEWVAPEETGDMSLAELSASVTRVLGVDLPISSPGEGGLLRRIVGGNTRVAERFRSGRVVLVGDAAHVHSAVGGPGLNLGLQDAANLGWKLAAEVAGRAPAGLLDTYERERRAAGERVVMHTQAQSALIAPGGEVTALRALFAELLGEETVVRRIAGLLAGSDVGYARWAPDLVLRLGDRSVRLAELTRDGGPLLLDFTGSLDGGPVPTVVARADTSFTALLVRPDGCVAWSSVDARPDAASLRAEIDRWFA